MSHSELFDEYAKMMEDQGLVSEAYGQEHRKDQYDLEAIEVLYGVKPNGKEDDKDMIEKAHPETAVVGRSYDAMNAVVENEHERQNIMAYIALKHPDGRHYHRRYVKAHQDLKMAVLKAAATLDNDDDAPMMKLADDCAGRLVKKGNPLAFLTAVPIMYWIYGAAAAGTAIAMFAAAAPSAKNVAQACNLVVTQAGEMGTAPYVEDVKREVSKLGQKATIFAGVSGEVTTLDNADARVDERKLKDMDDKVSSYAQKAQEVSGQIGGWITDVERHAKDDSTKESKWWSKLRSMTGFLGNPFSNVTKMKQVLNVLQRKIAESSSEQARIQSFVQRKRTENRAADAMSNVTQLPTNTTSNPASEEDLPMPKAAKARTPIARRRG